MVEDGTRPFLKEATMKNKLLRSEKQEISHYHSLNHEDFQGQKECTEGIFAVAIKPENFKEKNTKHSLCRQIKSESTGYHGYKSPFTLVVFSSS